MTLEKARKIWWNYEMSDADIEEWVWMVNNKPPDPPNVHVGETVPVAASIGLRSQYLTLTREKTRLLYEACALPIEL